MVKYRRFKIRGGVYFFTVTLQDRHSNYLTKYISLLTAAMRVTRERWPFKTIALVVLPDHLHAIWQMPDEDDNYSIRWMKIKSYFTQKLTKENISIEKNTRRECNLWQRRFWEHTIRDEIDYEKHVNYIHYNPVKHNLVKRVGDWPYSTFHRYVKNGVLPANWSTEPDDIYEE